VRLAYLEAPGKTLATAAKVAKCEPDSMGGRAAMERAREAVEKLAALRWPLGVSELVRVARRRVLLTR
jgi:DNA-binding NtrC family response regulator